MKKAILVKSILVISVIPAFGQIDNNYKEVKSIQVAEKVYLHIDRVLYNAGDDVWFKAYVIDPATNNLSLNTNNLHVEFISPDSRIIENRTVRIEDGTGHGDFHLNDSVPSGHYRIRAYTNYMRNYDDDFFFLKEITVINPYDNGKGLNRQIRSVENKLDITFFPEGGSLIDNVESRVAFKATNGVGKGCDVNIKLYTASGDLIATFKSQYLGMGYFNIKPAPGYVYSVVAQSKDGTETRALLPESFATGAAIRTRVTSERKLILTINTNEASLPLLSGRNLSLMLSSRNLVNTAINVRINSLVNSFVIPLDGMTDGILKVTLSGPEGLPLCERLVFLQKNPEARLNISTDKNEYKPREKVIAAISLTGDSSMAGTGKFSLAAAEERFTDNSSSPHRGSIASWFLLESDIRGLVEDPLYYFDPENKNRLQHLDILLMTQGWRDFKWKYDTRSAFKHEIGFTISGSVKRSMNNNPVEGANINLFLFSSGTSHFYTTRTDKSGSYQFENLDIDGQAEAFISSTYKSDNLQGRILVNAVGYEPPEIQGLISDSAVLIPEKNNYTTFQQEAITRLNNLKKYKLSDTINVGEVFVTARKTETPQEIRVKESRKLYNLPDKELKITAAAENYFGDIFSFMSGRLPGLRVERAVNPCSFYYPDDAEIFIREQFITEKIFCNKKQIEIKRGALLLLDGYVISQENLMSLLTLPMNIIDRIDVLNASPLYGMRGANGVVNIITRVENRKDNTGQSSNSVITLVKGFDIPRVFYSPKYDNSADRVSVPDYRTTLLWHPDIIIGKNKPASLEFYNGDNSGRINVKAEGITEEGIPLTGTVSYDVK